MKLERLFLALMVCAPTMASAQSGALDGEKDDLLALLDEQTELATKTRLNLDYVPGLMSVLHGRDLELRGVRTVWEALALVPGIERAMEASGRRKLLVRGMGNVWGSGNVKLLLNNVAMNTAERGLADPLLNIPIGQIERIEVVRGPGSAIHGEFAYLGVINVITRSDAPRLFAFGGSHDTYGGGAVARWAEGDVRVSASISGWRTDGADVRTGPDLLHQIGLAGESHAPGDSNEELESGTAVVRLEHGGFTLMLQWNQDALGEHFGINNVLPPEGQHIVERNRHRGIEARNATRFAHGFSTGVYLGWQDALTERKSLYSGPAELFYTTGPDIYGESRYLEQKLYGGIDLNWRPNAQHALLFGAQLTEFDVRESRTRFNLDPDSYQATTDLHDWAIGVQEGTTRTITSLTLQDEFRITDAFTLTAGARHDDYDDAGSRTTPRLAGVWRVNERHILKGQYAEGFRPATLLELTSDEAPDPAHIHTYELEYIYKGVRWEHRLTAFHSKLDDLVIFVDSPDDQNFGNGDATAWGAEWEQRYRLSARLALDGNVSYLETHDETSDRPFPGAPHWLANLGATYLYPRGVTWGIQLHHVGDMTRERADPRGKLAGYTTVDLTATLSRLELRGATWSIGIKNLFDADVRYPAGLNYEEQTPDMPYPPATYPEDYPRAGREWWTRVTYEF
jgi:iron complex outermembrane receptor protein